MLRLDREKDIEIVRQAAQLLERENHRLVSKIAALTQELLTLKGADPAQLRMEIAKLEEELAARNHQLFGASSEKRPHPEHDKTDKTPQRGHGPRSQPELPIVEQVHVLDAPDCTCPQCGKALEPWKGQYEESEEIDVIERRFVIKKIKREKSRCSCGHIETALAPLKLFEGARYSVDFAVEVAVSKYLDHLPLERQVRVMAREGLKVDSQTLWDQIERLARLLQPANEALLAYVKTHPVIGADETRWQVTGHKEPSKRWQVWTLAARDAVAYRLHDSRSADAAEKVLGDYTGIVMSDGYSVYEMLAKEGGRFRAAHCWAHVRRKFVEAEAFFPDPCREAIAMIGELYAVEKLCPTGPPGNELRTKLRAERSKPVVARLRDWAMALHALPESGLSKAVTYMSKIWKGLVLFLDDPRIPIDNNATERALRGVVVGRKNHYGSRSRRGTEVAALFYSLEESAKLVGIDPKAYLRTAAFAALRGETIALPHQQAR